MKNEFVIKMQSEVYNRFMDWMAAIPNLKKIPETADELIDRCNEVVKASNKYFAKNKCKDELIQSWDKMTKKQEE